MDLKHGQGERTMTGSFRIGSVAGIDLRIHYTWLFAFVLVAWSLADGFYPASFPSFDPITDWLLGIVSALLLFASVLIHELSHCHGDEARAGGAQHHPVHFRRRLGDRWRTPCGKG